MVVYSKSVPIVRDTFLKYSSVDINTYFGKYLKYLFAYSEKKVFEYK